MENLKHEASPEERLLEMIRSNDNPGRALMTATMIVLGYLKQQRSSSEPSPDLLQVSS